MEQIPFGAMDIRALALQDRQHRRGSLPLKKRLSSLSPHPSPVALKDDLLPGTDETLAALALIQAAASGSPPQQQRFQDPVRVPELPLLPRMERENDAKISLLSLHSRAFVHPVSMALSKHPDIDLTIDPPTEQETIGLSVSSDSTSDSLSSHDLYADQLTGHSGRVNTTPSRRRHGPSGRKIHYAEHDDADSSRQDKRFTGLAHEVCCSATTTRGRACAYVAVHGTRFCHLHAQTAATIMHSPARELTARRPSPDQELLDTQSTGSSKLLPSPLIHSSLQKKPRGRRASKLAETHAESPYFLLSMIPSEQWRGKNVCILTGPMKDREGSVEKWSNGWVTVHVPGAGSHNRRSIELAIVKDDKHENPKPARGYATIKTLGVNREIASPSPLSDLDSYHEAAVPRTPRVTTVAEGKEPFETPMSQVYCATVPSVTPGSTGSMLGMPLVAARQGSSASAGNAAHQRGRRSVNRPDRLDTTLVSETGTKRRRLGQAPPTKYKKYRAGGP